MSGTCGRLGIFSFDPPLQPKKPGFKIDDSLPTTEPIHHLEDHFLPIRRPPCILDEVDVEPLGELGVVIVGGTELLDEPDVMFRPMGLRKVEIIP